MILTLSLTPEIEEYLTQKAVLQGLSTEAYVLQMRGESLEKEKQTKLVDVLQSWIDEDDAQEQ